MLQASIIQLLELNKYYLFEPGYNYLDTILRAESNHFKVLKLNFNSIPATNDISLKSAYHYAKDVLSQPHELLQRENLISFRQMFEQSAIKNAIMFEYNESHFLEEEHFQRFRDISLFSTKNYLQYLESITEYLTKCRDARRSKYILVQRCTEYIDKHLQEDITRNSIARMAYLNVDYLDRCFRKEIGVTISQYILNSRMELACKLLMDCSMSIQTISTYVGYQKLENNKQKEEKNPWITPESWLTDTGVRFTVPFGGFSLRSVMYDVGVPGYNGQRNSLHLFDVETVDESIIGDGIAFDKSDIARNLTLFLYPDDSDEAGRLLRVYQQYFLVSSTAQLILKETRERGGSIEKLHEFVAVQINDTHPTMISAPWDRRH